MRALRQYRTGFERIGMILFVLVAGAIALLHALARTGYDAPAPGSAAHARLTAVLEGKCGGESNDLMAYLCRQAATADERWHYLLGETDLGTYSIALLAVIVIAAVFAGRWAMGWVADGFRARPPGGSSDG